VYRQLTEAYVALDAVGLAATSCAEWRKADPGATLDPIELSPKIMGACIGERRPAGGAAAAPDAGGTER
jgi:hypothetical protein